MDTRRATLGALAYMVPTFAIAFIWHLEIFAAYYDRLMIYRPDKVIPLGFAAIAIQGAIFSLAYRSLFAGSSTPRGALRFAVAAGLLSWTFTTLAVAAKHPMTSVGGFVLVETAFTLLQFAVVGPLMALAWSGAQRFAEA
jgi:tetrahydromethanopterin S-methyltransferase subunit C